MFPAMARTSLPSLVLGLLLMVSNIFVHAAVLGVDFGTEYIKVALVKPGIPLEIVLTKDSRRKETSAVTFKPSRDQPQSGAYPERFYGSDAMALSARFPGDVYANLKSLLGQPFESEAVKIYSAHHPTLRIEPNKRGTAAFKSQAFSDDEGAWTVEELIAMQLQNVKKNAEDLAGPGVTVKSVVLTVPPFYTIEEKRAIQLAAELAGLKVLSLVSDGLAVGLNYATSRTFPNQDDGATPEIHMVFDMGAGSTKASVMRFQSRTVKDVGKFNKTIQEVQVVGTGWDRSLGGDALNSIIVEDMMAHFVETPAAQKAGVTVESIRSHGRAIAKLSKDAERVRHILSANQMTAANFEGLYDDMDFKYKITRTEFEELALAHADRVEIVVKSALESAELQVSDLDSIILHGGASRTPFVQRQLEKLMGDVEKIRTNVNSDEAAVFGAGFRAAGLSPSFRVKDIRISECTGYPAGIRWADGNGKDQQQRLWLSTSHLGGTGEEVTFNNREDFSVTFYQDTSEVVAVDTHVLTTTNLTASIAELKERYGCIDDDIQLKAGMQLANTNGEVVITNISVECEVEEPNKETFVDGVKNLFGFGKNKDSKDQKAFENADGEEDTDSSAPIDNADSSSTSFTSASAETAFTPTSSSSKTSAAEDSAPADTDLVAVIKKLVIIDISYTLARAGTPTLTKVEMATSKDRLRAFASSDRQRKLREEALNELEGYTYKVRDLIENEAFVAASTEEERTTLTKKSSEVSDWIYDDGADAPREELGKRLKELEDIVNPIQIRSKEAEKRPLLVADLRDALKKSTEFVGSIRDAISEHAKWEAARVASSSSETESSSTTNAPEAEESGEFVGLEDKYEDAAAASSTILAEEEIAKERGPVPPFYKEEDLADLEAMIEDISKWLDNMSSKQDKLAETEDPVLLVKDLEARRTKLDKLGVDLAMKSVRNIEKKEKEKKSSSKISSAKSKKSKTAKTNGSSNTTQEKKTEATNAINDEYEEKQQPIVADKAEATPTSLRPQDVESDDNYIKLNADGNIPSAEDIEEMIRKIQEKQQRGGNVKHDEL